MTIKIEDISRRLGLSVSTISKALNGYDDVADGTRKRVLETAAELGYHPNAAARSLRRRRTDRVGFLINTSITYTKDYLAEVIPGAAYAAEEEGTNLMLYTAAIQNPLTQLRKLSQGGEVDGVLIFWSKVIEDAIDLLENETALPYVVFGRRIDHPNASYIAPDNLNGARKLTDHLIELGHKRIGFMSRPALGNTNVDRTAGFRQAMGDAGLEVPDELITVTEIEPLSGYHAMNYYLDLPKPPTAVFAFHDYVAVDAHKAALERGLRIPEDLALVGFDGLRVSATTSPPITTAHYPLFEMGARGVKMLRDKIQTRDAPPIREVVPVELEIRRSTKGDE